jgi:cell division inhibitor SulA
MFYTVEGEVEELETLLQIYRNKIVETVELENDVLNNGRMNHVKISWMSLVREDRPFT